MKTTQWIKMSTLNVNIQCFSYLATSMGKFFLIRFIVHTKWTCTLFVCQAKNQNCNFSFLKLDVLAFASLSFFFQQKWIQVFVVVSFVDQPIFKCEFIYLIVFCIEKINFNSISKIKHFILKICFFISYKNSKFYSKSCIGKKKLFFKNLIGYE